MKNELTDEQVEEITERHVRQVGDHWCHESAIVEADALAFARAIIAAHEALQAGQEPTLVQYRMAANWNEPRRWTDWDDCSPEAAADYERIKVLHDWEYQVRRLYAAPQPAPDKDAEIADQSRVIDALTAESYAMVLRKDAEIAALKAEMLAQRANGNLTLVPADQLRAMQTEIAALREVGQDVLDWTELAHRPPVRELVPCGGMALVRIHALANLHDVMHKDIAQAVQP